MQKIIIIDYGMGNVFSIQKKFNSLGINCICTSDYKQITNSDKIILPGVGHFAKAMHNLKDLNLIDVLNESVLIQKKPIMGICLGMQLMANYSEEGNCNGLGWFDAKVKKFTVKDGFRYKIPHVGWNSIKIHKNENILNGIMNDSDYYFVHSYHIDCNDQKDILTQTEYEYHFTSSIHKNNIFGFQFHPEKSQENGTKLFENFISL